MNYTIKNELLSVGVSSKGGEFQSIKDASGREYLWQGDEATWPDRGPNLFPYIARMTEGTYTYGGEKYHMDIHGFLPYTEMTLVSQEESRLVLGLKSCESTLRQYPFEFNLEIQWELKGKTLEITYRVTNEDNKTMYFGIGGHPGFQVPMEDGMVFEDYMIDLGEGAAPLRVGMSDDCFVTGEDTPFALREGRYLDLKHNLFDDDAIILRDMPRKVTLKSKNGEKAIQVAFPGMSYLGIWHFVRTEVPYVCIEPWTSLPSRKNVIEDLETQEDLISLEAGKVYENKWTIELIG